MSNLEQFPSERGFSDRFTVDRDELRRMSTALSSLRFSWNTDGGSREVTNSLIRRAITMQERLEAWRELCALPDAKRVESFWQ